MVKLRSPIAPLAIVAPCCASACRDRQSIWSTT